MKIKSTLHHVGGRKGGSGKSVFSNVLAAQKLSKQEAFTIAECDRSNPDVGRIYRKHCDVIYAYFTEDERRRSKADALFAEALKQPVIANLPAQVHPAMKAWFEQDALYELAEQEGIALIHWYVSNGGYDSIKLFSKTVKDLGQYMQHVFVRNWGLCDDWSHLEVETEFNEAVEEYQVPVIDLPKCPYLERNFIEANQLTLLEAETHPGLSVVSQQRIKIFLRKAFGEIERSGYA